MECEHEGKGAKTSLKYEVATDVAEVAVAGNDQLSTPNHVHDLQ